MALIVSHRFVERLTVKPSSPHQWLMVSQYVQQLSFSDFTVTDTRDSFTMSQTLSINIRMCMFVSDAIFHLFLLYLIVGTFGICYG